MIPISFGRDALDRALARITDDERLRSNMSDAQAAIWLHAACEHLREASRQGRDLILALVEARSGLVAVNRAMGEEEKP